MSNKITIIGSINGDTAFKMAHLPKPGETIHATEVTHSGGGKGANQAIAAKRSGADVFFIGAVGNDELGRKMIGLLKKEEINTAGISIVEKQDTGCAFVLVNEDGENSIVVNSGANNELTAAQVERNRVSIENSDFVMAQFETNLESTIKAFEIAVTSGIKTILNPAPAKAKIPKVLLSCTDIIIPNESEAEVLTGIKITDKDSMEQAAAVFHNMGIRTVLITLGSRGCYYDDLREGNGIVAAAKVSPIDTTAAGDTFIGALASLLKPDLRNLREAIVYGNQASAITIQQNGAQPSIPFRDEIAFRPQIS